ncbi:MAG: DMT family transporter [Actinomycetospora chiangmaiensis]|nr:DMT family transporter [Actinomycetospora chiangmaiensis]
MVSIQGGAAFAKTLFPSVGSGGTSALRVGFAALLLLVVWRPWRRPLTAREAGWIALYGGALGVMNVLFYAALARLPLGPAVALEFSGPLALAIVGSRRRSDFAWIALAILGLGLLLPLRGTGGLDPLGSALALAAGVAWALYILFGQRAGRVDGGQAVALGMVAAALVAVPVGLAESGTALFSPGILASGLAIAILSSALPYSLEMVALRRLDRTTFGVLMSLEPALGALLAFAVLGETLSAVQWLAIALVIVASAGITATRRPRRDEPAPLATAGQP